MGARFFTWLASALLLSGPDLTDTAAQTILLEAFTNISGGAVANLTSAPDFPYRPAVRFETNVFEGLAGFGTNYGTRLRGYVLPPSSGDYVFWIASDDQSELWLSADDQPTNLTRIARVTGYTARREWTKEPNQQSAPVALEAGRRYYIEALHKQSIGGENLAVGWQLPDGALERPIPGARLQPWLISSNPPAIIAGPLDVVTFEDGPADFAVVVSGEPPWFYQWHRDGQPLVGETGAALFLDGLQLADNGRVFHCVVSNYFGATTSRLARLTVIVETNPPMVALLNPPAAGTVRALAQIEVLFDEAVSGVDAMDLLVNGQPATNVNGLLAGPYVFQFPPVAAGLVTLEWSQNHGITDLSANSNAFAGGSWTCTVDPAHPPGELAITEFMAANETTVLDEDGQPEDWIEIQNRGPNAVNLRGWSLSDDAGLPGQWVFPSCVLEPGGFLVVFASGKDRRSGGTNALHTNFKLSAGGEHLGLYSPESPRALVSGFAPAYPEQRTDVSYGLDPLDRPAYFETPTPGASNGLSSVTGVVAEVHFNIRRCVFNYPFNLSLYTPTPGATIRYTTDGSPPTLTNGAVYTGSIRIAQTTLLRAAGFKEGCLPSRVATHTYLSGLVATQLALPVLSLVTASNNLIGRTGIMGIGGGTYSNGVWVALTTNDFFNPTNHGPAWERPVSAELILPWDPAGGFQIDAGLRVQGSDYSRPRYTPTSKFSFRLYFRGDYGAARLEYPLFEESPVTTFDVISLRGGHNDRVNPFLKDELVRRLLIEMGQVQLHGTFMNLWLNGAYQGYYNPCDRVENGFLQAHHGGGEEWDVITVGSRAQDGDMVAWNALRSFVANNSQAVPDNYLHTLTLLDVTNFVDYLLVNAWCATRDWPHNNWRAARERAPGGRFRFYIWDAEGAFGTFGQPVSYDVFNAPTNISGEVLATGTREIARLYQGLRASPEFRLFFADRVHRHLDNDGALTDANVARQFNLLRTNLLGVIPNMDLSILANWVPNRRPHLLTHLAAQGLLASSNAPVFNQHGGRVPPGFALTMSNLAGTIYFTTNGADPRVPFTGEVAPEAAVWTPGSVLALRASVVVKARSLSGTNWSALTEAAFTVGGLLPPLCFTEIMFNPAGGEAYEFFELHNYGTTPYDLSGHSFQGVNLVVPTPTVIAPGATLVLANGADPALFATRYPGVTVTAWYDGRLDNAGERLALLDPSGHVVTAVDYDDEDGWPGAADGGGASLVLLDPFDDLSAPANWVASPTSGGSPGRLDAIALPTPAVRLNELQALNVATVTNGPWTPDWIELHNTSAAPVDISGWSLSDDSDPRKFVFPANTVLEAGAFLVVWCDTNAGLSGLRADFALNGDGETVMLFDERTNRVDALSFGRQLPDFALGRLEADWNLCVPTPGSTNVAAPLASLTELVLNEWMANPLPGQPDWMELYNPNPNRPVALRGLCLGNGTQVDQVRSLSFLGPDDHLLLLCDAQPGRLHLNFKLPANGSPLVLYDALGNAFHTYNNPAQQENVSSGRVPDGSTRVLNFYGRATPGARNSEYNTAPLQLNEVMARNVAAVTNPAGVAGDWIELYNPTSTNVPLAGFSLSLDEPRAGQWLFPPDLVLTSRTYLVVWCDASRPVSTNLEPFLNLGRNLDGESGAIYLFGPRGQLYDSLEYGFQAADFSLGRVGANWRLLASPTPGAANSAQATLGTPISLRLNEWMARPAAGDDWFELFNTNTLPVNLAGVFLADDASLSGQTNFALPANSFIGGRSWVKIVADGNRAAGRNHAGFALDAEGETLRIYYPVAGTLIDAVDFGLQALGVSQGRYPDGGPTLLNFASYPTPGARNVADEDNDFLDDQWELAHGLNPNDPLDAGQDPDADGATNLHEFHAGTDPRDPGSLLRLRFTNNGAGAIVLEFDTALGRSYDVLCADALAGSPWHMLTNVPPAPAPRVIQITDTAPETAGHRFYRVRLSAEGY